MAGVHDRGRQSARARQGYALKQGFGALAGSHRAIAGAVPGRDADAVWNDLLAANSVQKQSQR